MITAAAPLRLGIAGLTHDHVQFLDRLPAGTIQIVGVQESDQSLRAAFAEAKNLAVNQLFADLEKMLAVTRPDVVAAFGSTLEHLEVVGACAPLGIHVILEKPLAIDLRAAHEIARLATVHGIQILTNYETSWYPSTHRLIDLAASAEFGNLRKVIFYHGHSGPKEIEVSPPFFAWLTDAQRNGAGALFDFGCYGANLATRLMGDRDPLAITAVTRRLKGGAQPSVDDDATILIDYDAAQAVVLASWNWPIGRKDVELYFERGEARSQDSAVVVVRTGSLGDRLVDGTKPAVSNAFDQLRAFLAHGTAIEPNDLGSLANNLQVMRILEAARLSAATGRTVPWDRVSSKR